MSTKQEVHRNLLPMATRTATTEAGRVSIPGHARGLYFLLETEDSATPQTLQIDVQRVTEEGNARRYVASNAVAVPANNQMSLTVYPGGTMSGSGAPNPTIRQLILPPGEYNIRVLHSSTGTWRYRLDVWLLY